LLVLLILIALNTSCSRASAPADQETAERFVTENHHWEFLLTDDALLGPGPPPSPPDMPEGAWRPLDELAVQDFRDRPGIWVRMELPSIPLEEPRLLLTGSAGTFAVYAGNQVVFQYGDFSIDRPVREARSLFHIVTLPRDFARRYLHIWRPHPISDALDYGDAILTANSSVLLIISELRHLAPLRADLADLLFGVLFIGAGLSLVLVSPFQWREQGRSLLLLGLAGTMNGARLLAEQTTLHLMIDWSEATWRYLTSYITYAIPIPLILWIREVLGWGWKSSIRILFYIQVSYSLIAILYDAFTGIPESAMAPNSYIVLAMMALVVVALRQAGMHRNRGLYLVGGFVILSVINDNMVGAGLVPWDLEFETLGWFVGFCGLTWFAVNRYYRTQRDLQAIEFELQTARAIQASILPERVPQARGWDIAVRYVPMAEVAGDFYDFIRVDEQRLGVLIADVSGHGVPAALIASMVKVAVESQMPNASDPARVLSGMNQTFCGNLEGQFITAGYLFLNTLESEIVYAGAGHPPALLWRASTGEAQEFGENGLLFANFENASYSNTRIDLQSGDRIVLYTDGIVEAESGREEQFGDGRLREFVSDNRVLAAGAFADALLGHLTEWTGSGDPRPRLRTHPSSTSCPSIG
jgi:hypothetical protein